MALLLVMLIWGSTGAAFLLAPVQLGSHALFGVSLPKEHVSKPEVLTIRKQYMKWSASMAAILASVGILSGIMGVAHILTASSLAMSIYLFCSILLFVQGRKKIKHLKAARGWESTAPYDDQEASPAKSGVPLKILNILPFIIIAINVILVALYYDSIPDRIPMHYNIVGDITWEAPKSILSVFFLNIIQLLLALLLLVLKRFPINTLSHFHSPEKAAIHQREIRRFQSVAIPIFISLLIVYFTFLQLIDFQFSLVSFGMANTFLITVILIYLVISIVADIKIGRAIKQQSD